MVVEYKQSKTEKKKKAAEKQDDQESILDALAFLGGSTKPIKEESERKYWLNPLVRYPSVNLVPFNTHVDLPFWEISQ